MKKHNLLVALFALVSAAQGLAAQKAFKGESPSQNFHVGGMAGIGVIDSRVGASFQGTAAVKIMNRGFVDDINNQLFVEAAFGPLLLSGSTVFQYSFHLRWDFIKDLDWTFYALGGFGGMITGSSYSPAPPAPGRAVSYFYPRFGLGAMWGLFEMVSLRAELSHEFIGLGAVVLL